MVDQAAVFGLRSSKKSGVNRRERDVKAPVWELN
jgi:hypothetical protein